MMKFFLNIVSFLYSLLPLLAIGIALDSRQTFMKELKQLTQEVQNIKQDLEKSTQKINSNINASTQKIEILNENFEQAFNPFFDSPSKKSDQNSKGRCVLYDEVVSECIVYEGQSLDL